MRRIFRGLTVLTALSASACEITEITVTEPVSLVIVEGIVEVVDGGDEDLNRATVLLHETFGGGRAPVEGAIVTVTLDDGEVVTLQERDSAEPCAAIIPALEEGFSCYGPALDLELSGGDVVTLQVDLRDGGRIRGQTRVPGDFQLTRPTGDQCYLTPLTNLEVEWTVSDGAWSYVSDTSIDGLRFALAPLGIPVEEDPFNLFGLAISAEDTTIVLPAEFGVFDRTDLERDLAVLLQTGLPSPTRSEVAVAAVDRNYINWVRGGNFNPSGQIRIPSVVGDGTGFFGSTQVRRFTTVVLDQRLPSIPDCTPDAT